MISTYPVVTHLPHPPGYGLRDHCLLSIAAATDSGVPPEQDLSINGIQAFVNDGESIQLMILDGAPMECMLPVVVRSLLNRPGVLRRIARAVVVFVLPLLKFLLKFGPIRAALRKAVGINVCLTRPTSKGTVMIVSKEPAVPPAIDPNFLSTEMDRQALLTGLSLAENILAAKPVASIVTSINEGPANYPSSEDFVREACASYWHPTGTCAMGPCLDSALRVHGTKGLRVADASSLPVHPRVPTQAACMAVGAKCADLILHGGKSPRQFTSGGAHGTIENVDRDTVTAVVMWHARLSSPPPPPRPSLPPSSPHPISGFICIL
jgi:hypothetical protein